MSEHIRCLELALIRFRCIQKNSFTVVTCPEITLTLDHGQQWLPHASEFGSVTNSSCDTGYKHTSGNQRRECQANGTWSGTHPICSS